MRRSSGHWLAVVSLFVLATGLTPGAAAAGTARQASPPAEMAVQDSAPAEREAQDLAPPEGARHDVAERLRAEEAPPGSVARELARLNRTLARIVELLERQTEGQRLDLALQRLELESDRVAALEEELRRTQSTKQSLEDQQFTIRTRLAAFADQIESAEAEASVEQLEALEQQVAQAERMLERFQGQAADAERRILEIENELARRRGDLRALQDRLDRQLEGM